ncbi:MAG: hypothetical protein SGARI_003881 [Bacillariaceae sp.]
MGKASSDSKKPSAVSAKKTAAKAGDSGFNKLPMKTRVLTVLASQRAMGKDVVEKKMVATMCSVTNHHTFDTALSGMKKKGLIESEGGTLKLTEAGLEEIGPDVAAPPADNTAAQDMLKGSMKQSSGKTRAMFDVLTDGRAYSRAEIADMVAMDEGAKTFKTYISYLSKLVDKVEGGKIRLKDEAFPFGRPCDKEDAE